MNFEGSIFSKHAKCYAPTKMPLCVSQILTGNDNIFKQSSNISPQSNNINNSRCLQSQQAVQFFFSSDNRNKKNLKFQTQRNCNRFKSQRSKRNLLYSRQMLNNNNQTLISMLENNSELNKTGEITNQNNEDIDKYKACDIDKDILKLYYSNLSIEKNPFMDPECKGYSSKHFI